MGTPVGRLVKMILPRGLLGRSLLILCSPLVLVQIIAAYVFFGTHWDVVTRRLSAGIAGDVGAVVELLHAFPDQESRQIIFAMAESSMDLSVSLDEGGILERTGMTGQRLRLDEPPAGPSFEANLVSALGERVDRPFFIDTKSFEREIDIKVQLTEGLLDIRVPRKRLYSPTTAIFLLWMLGSSLLFLGIATIFMRNQVRAVRRLAAAADGFGKGHDVPNFKPEGAAEVRQAAAAFTLMRERIKRQVAQRTEMLAGVSHDLRTPLTRMKLQLAMMEPDLAQDLAEDVAEMEHMVEGYLAFARGDGTERPEPVDFALLLETVVGRLRRGGGEIDLHCEEELPITLRPHAVERCLANLIGNALRYGRHVMVRARKRGGAVEVLIDDDGPGIPPDKRADVFRAFVRLEESRNVATGGIGLGLTIARDVVRGHGGDIALEDSPLGGLRVRLRLPL